MSKFLCFTLLLFSYLGYAQNSMPWLHVEGNKIKDPAGNIVVLRGVNVQDVKEMADETINYSSILDTLTNTNAPSSNSPGWYPKIIRIPIHPTNNLEADYENYIKPAVDSATAKGLYVIIDNHLVEDIDANIEYTHQFWEFLAPKFKNYSNVLYEVYNEPINQSMSWSQFKPYMQEWVNTIRKHAPHNLILIGSPSWSQRVGGSATDPIIGDNLVYVSHIYPGHWGPTSYVRAQAEQAAAVHPVFLTEWGFRTPVVAGDDVDQLLQGTISSFGQPIVDWMENRGLSWTAWVADNDWEPAMFTNNWQLRIGENDMGGFVKDKLYEFRSEDQPTSISCAVPFLGPNRTLCSPDPINLETTLTPEFKVFQWYSNGDSLHGETGPALSNVTTAGLYKVTVDSGACLMADEILVIDTLFPVDLGPDAAITDDSLELIAGSADPNFTYVWQKNGELISTSTNSIKVKDTCGTIYSVEVTYTGCPTASDELEILCARELFLGAPINIPARVQAEHFDGQNVPNTAYYDRTAGNEGNSTYRSEDVDIENSLDVGRGYNIGYTANNEWFEYTVKVTTPGTYYAYFRTASEPAAGGRLSMLVNGRTVASNVVIPSTGDWQEWTTVGSPTPIELAENDTIIRIRIVSGGFNLNWFEFTENAPVAIVQGKAKESAITVYPNPATNKLRIESAGANAEWRIINALGSELLSGKGAIADVTVLTPGTYIILVNGIPKTFIKK